MPMVEKHIGIMGGTFNPIHNGHILIAQHCLEKFALDYIYFLPSGNPPHKQLFRVADKHDRFEMTRLATSFEPRFLVSDIEIKRDGNTYTFDTMQELNDTYPDTEFFYIIGADTLKELYSWYRIEDLAHLVKFLVVGRPNVPVEQLHIAAQKMRTDFGVQLIDADFCGPLISSTEVRKRAQQGLSLDGLVPEEVEDYIYRNKIY